MIPSTPDLANVLSRLERLEKQNRRWKGAVLFVLLIFGTALSMGAAQPPAKVDPPAKVNRFEEVQAKRFLLLDNKGKVRADLVMSGFGQPALLLYGEKGTERISILLEKDGNPRISGVVHEEGAPVFQAWDSNGKLLLKLPK
jgi:hypothetical protein